MIGLWTNVRSSSFWAFSGIITIGDLLSDLSRRRLHSICGDSIRPNSRDLRSLACILRLEAERRIFTHLQYLKISTSITTNWQALFGLVRLLRGLFQIYKKENRCHSNPPFHNLRHSFVSTLPLFEVWWRCWTSSIETWCRLILWLTGRFPEALKSFDRWLDNTTFEWLGDTSWGWLRSIYLLTASSFGGKTTCQSGRL